jgi:hypothetical protein
MLDETGDAPGQNTVSVNHLSDAIKEIYAAKPSAPPKENQNIELHGGKKIEFDEMPDKYIDDRPLPGTELIFFDNLAGSDKKDTTTINPAYGLALGMSALSTLAAGMAGAGLGRINYVTSGLTLGASTYLDFYTYRAKTDAHNHRAAEIGLASDALLAAGIITGLATAPGRIALSAAVFGMVGKVASGMMYERETSNTG